jgi:hypothetical protein
MNVYYVNEVPPEMEWSPNSVFLAGPTPRNKSVLSWRPDAITALKDAGFCGDVFVPERREGVQFDYVNQVEWEEKHLKMAGCILFWVPRNMDTMPALTTNVEFGMWYNSGKIVLGVPPTAVHCNYLIYYARKVGAPVVVSLPDAASAVCRLVKERIMRPDDTQKA